MSSTKVCSRCQQAIPESAPEGACPACLLQLAVDISSSSSSAGTFVPPDVAELNEQIPSLQVQKLIGRGGMSAVYLARQKMLNRDVALKILPRERARDPEFVERFFREATALAKLNHPHIVNVFDAGRSSDYLYIVMEYVDGVNLRTLIRDGRLVPFEAMDMVRQICDAMQYVHDHGVVHRDIKPENVLVDNQGRIKVADFGLAKLTYENTREQAELTRTNVRMGTMGYMSPEQFANTAAVDHRADIYSLGIIFYEMLTGELPTLEFNRPSQKVDIDPRVDQVVARSTRERPSDRYQQAVEVRNDVDRIATTPRVNVRFLVMALVLILAGVLGAGIWNWQKDRPVPIAAARQTVKPDAPESVAPSGWHGWPANAPRPAIAPFDAEQASKHQAEWAEYLNVPVEYENHVGMKFRLLPPGEFVMGSTPEEIDDALKVVGNSQHWQQGVKSEAPLHTVILTHPVYVGVTEVTQLQFETVMGWNPAHFSHTGTNKYGVEKVKGLEVSGHSVETVSWNDATDFCSRLGFQQQLDAHYVRSGTRVSNVKGNGYRLLAEAEWEFACRAGTTSRYWGGISEDKLLRTGWVGANSGNRTHTAAELPSNPFGLFDMHGNVYEWVEDGWDPTLYQQFATKSAINPMPLPSFDSRRVVRGGTWISSLPVSRSSSRNSFGPTDRINGIGFRVALTVDAVKQVINQPPEKVLVHNWPSDAPSPAIAPFSSDDAAKHQRDWAAHLKLPVEYTNSLGMKFRLIPPGEYEKGSSQQEVDATVRAVPNNKGWHACVKSETPRHKVILTQPYYIGVSEVTQSQFERVTGQKPARFVNNAPDTRTAERVNGLDTSNFPVESVSWNDAADFCVKLSQLEQLTPSYFRNEDNVVNVNGNGYRFPTEAEWEFACRAGTTTRFWNGDQEDQLQTIGWIGANSGGRPHAVGELPANPFGLFDVHGNVWEWVEDAWVPTIYRRFAERPVIDPIVRSTVGGSHALRGGFWGSVPLSCRSSSHHASYPTDILNLIGFRVALPINAVRQAMNPAPVKAALDRSKRVKDLLEKSLTLTPVSVSAHQSSIGLLDAELIASHVLTSPDWEWSEPVRLLHEDDSIKSFAPDISADGLHLVFTTEQSPENVPFLREMYRASLSAQWEAPRSLVGDFPTVRVFGGSCTSRDGTVLTFNSPDYHPAASGDSDLWMVTRKSVSDPWGDPAPLPKHLNSRGKEWSPYLTNDGLTLFWAADRALTGETDLWTARRSSVDKPFGEPESLGNKVNSPAMENNPKLTLDERVLIFASNRESPLGPQIVYLSVREHRNAPWSIPVNPGTLINMPGSDSHATVANDGRTMILSRYGDGKSTLWTTQRIPRPTSPEPAPADTPISDKTDAELAASHILTSPDWEWSAPKPIFESLDATAYDFHPGISPDGLTLTFASKRSSDRRILIWNTTRSTTDSAWSQPTQVQFLQDNGVQQMSSPCVSADGLTLLFDCGDSHPDGSGSDDLWITKRGAPTLPWNVAVPMGKDINWSGRDWNPFLSHDGLTLLWSSDRPGGVGDMDLWMAERDSIAAPFGTPRQLGPNVNSPMRDHNPELSADGLALVFGSERFRSKDEVMICVRKNRSSPWSRPIKVVHTGNEQTWGSIVTITADCKTLIFETRDSLTSNLFFVHRLPKHPPADPPAEKQSDSPTP